MGIPSHIRDTINNIHKAEKGFAAVDYKGLPALDGITAVTWYNWCNEGSPGLFTSYEQAADDLRFIAGKGGKSYTGTSRSEFNTHFVNITYQKYFAEPGFDRLISKDIQSYALEIAYHRGPETARWALNYAAGIEDHTGDPLYDKRTARPDERDHAISYANGFLSTGTGELAAENARLDHGSEKRFYSRMRTAKLVAEAHFVADREIGSKGLGLVKRAIEFPWMHGLDADRPYFTKQDAEFRNTYSTYHTILRDYQSGNITRAVFDEKLVATADNFVMKGDMPAAVAKYLGNAPVITTAAYDPEIEAQRNRAAAGAYELPGIAAHDADMMTGFITAANQGNITADDRIGNLIASAEAFKQTLPDTNKSFALSTQYRRNLAYSPIGGADAIAITMPPRLGKNGELVEGGLVMFNVTIESDANNNITRASMKGKPWSMPDDVIFVKYGAVTVELGDQEVQPIVANTLRYRDVTGQWQQIRLNDKLLTAIAQSNHAGFFGQENANAVSPVFQTTRDGRLEGNQVDRVSINHIGTRQEGISVHDAQGGGHIDVETPRLPVQVASRNKTR